MSTAAALEREALALGLRAEPLPLGRRSFRGVFAGCPVSCEALVDGIGVRAVGHAHVPHALRLGLAVTSPGGTRNQVFESFIDQGTSALRSGALAGWRQRAADVTQAQQLLDALGGLAEVVSAGEQLHLDDQQVTLTAPYAPGGGPGSLQHTLTRVAAASEQVLAAWGRLERPGWELSTLRRWRELGAREGWQLDEAALTLHAMSGGTPTSVVLRRAPMVMTLETEVVARPSPPRAPDRPGPPSLALSLSAPGTQLPMLAAFGLASPLEELDLDDPELESRFAIAASDAEIALLALNQTVRGWLCELPAAITSGNLHDRQLVLRASEALGAADLVAAIHGCARLARALAT
ncbi:MAG: hypothetical protein IT370_32755 [Deltaproteobacteria bacterium]|nr:hypothetical protein [Deltaproteobacteria bacterium]